jgi:hypothetical protein
MAVVEVGLVQLRVVVECDGLDKEVAAVVRGALRWLQCQHLGWRLNTLVQ